MDSKLFHQLKYKVTLMAPAIFADNMMILILSKYDVPWNPMFTTEEYRDQFFHTSGINIALDIEDIFQPWYDIYKTCPVMWQDNEEALSKLLYILKIELCRKSLEDLKTHFLIYCASMVYFALDYYKKGVASALNIVFLEVYFLACYYSERMNFKCDLISTSTEV